MNRLSSDIKIVILNILIFSELEERLIKSTAVDTAWAQKLLGKPESIRTHLVFFTLEQLLGLPILRCRLWDCELLCYCYLEC